MRCDWVCKWCGSGRWWDVIDYVNDVEVEDDDMWLSM